MRGSLSIDSQFQLTADRGLGAQIETVQAGNLDIPLGCFPEIGNCLLNGLALPVDLQLRTVYAVAAFLLIGCEFGGDCEMISCRDFFAPSTPEPPYKRLPSNSLAPRTTDSQPSAHWPDTADCILILPVGQIGVGSSWLSKCHIGGSFASAVQTQVCFSSCSMAQRAGWRLHSN